jgi:hypothetical protein
MHVAAEKGFRSQHICRVYTKMGQYEHNPHLQLDTCQLSAAAHLC